MMRELLMLLILTATLTAQKKPLPVPQIEYNPRMYQVVKASQQIVVDGSITKKEWATATWSDDFIDIRGENFPQPHYRTRFKMLWDDQYLYMAAEMEEPQLWATLTRRDTIIYFDNDFEVFIDPDGDTHNYFELEINALNTVWDLFLDKPYRDGAHPLSNWDIHGLRNAVRLLGTLNQPADVDTGWTVELAIPWTAFQFSARRSARPKAGDQWHVNFSRVQWPGSVVNGHYEKQKDASGKQLREDNWVWSPQGLVAMHYPEMWGIVQFSDSAIGIAPSAITEQQKIDWLLRRVYYRQMNYFREHGQYASWKELQFEPRDWSPDYPTPQIFTTPGLWEAHLSSPDRKICRHIRYDGLIWQDTDCRSVLKKK